MIIKIGDKEFNTAHLAEPVGLAFRQDEIWNFLLFLAKNTSSQKFAIFPANWTSDQKKQYFDSITVPKTPKAVQNQIAQLREQFEKGLSE